MKNKKSDLIQLSVTYAIECGELKTEIMYPYNFLALDAITQVNLISSLIDLLNSSEVPEELADDVLSLDESHRQLVTECTQLFPFGSQIKLNISNDDKSGDVQFEHDDSVGSLHKVHLMVLVDSIIKVLSAMAIMIVNKTENPSK
ncbi:hypothetical protein [Pseudoalteromonas prydzensis]|uniref:hypothetical protein n=1 Tax=Pseudoalteromonas prydzensis TaxID=182141 RepID=UPI003FD325C6